MKKHIIIIILLCIISCKENIKKQPENRTLIIKKIETKNPYSDITLYDNFNNKLILDTIKTGRDSQFSPMYIGKIKDSINLIYKTSKIKSNYINDDIEYRVPKQNELDIYIDTTKTVGFSMKVWGSYKTKEYRTNKESYPIFIRNLSNDTLNIGYGYYIGLVTQVYDSTKNWNSIEKLYIYECGTGLNLFYLPPNEIAITSLRKNYGNTKVKFRAKYGYGKNFMYSNEINGKIK